MWLSYWTYPYNPIIAKMGKEIGRSYKYYRSKISNPTLKKPVLSSSANHTSYTTTSTPTIMSYQTRPNGKQNNSAPSGGKSVVFGNSTGKRGKLVFNGVKRGGVVVA